MLTSSKSGVISTDLKRLDFGNSTSLTGEIKSLLTMTTKAWVSVTSTAYFSFALKKTFLTFLLTRSYGINSKRLVK